MKRVLVAIAIAVLILAFTATAALAHGGPSGQDLGCCGSSCQDYRPHGADYYGSSNCEGCPPDRDRRYEAGYPEGRIHNPAVPETISGAVIDVYQTPSKLGQGDGLHLLLKTDGEMLDVHLGPEWWLNKQNFSIEPGDSLEIKGARFTKDGTPAMIAFEMKQGDEILILRDEDSFPMWRRSPQVPKGN